VKRSSTVRATHVNSGTSIPRSELGSSVERGREFRHPKLHVGVESSATTALGGLALAAGLAARLQMPQSIDRHVCLLRSRRPFHESDHVLTHVYNLFVGGTAIEDIADLQHSESVRRMLGASRIPDPSTAGDFLRRFDEGAIAAFDRAIDEIQQRAWRRHYGVKKCALGVVDLDSHLHHVYGNQKEGADFTHEGGFGYHPLVISLAETQECLRLVNRPGNVTSAEGAAQQLSGLVPMLQSRFKDVLVRGDSAFARQDIFDVCDHNGLFFAMVSAQHQNFPALAEALKEPCWRPFRATEQRSGGDRKTRRRGRDLRRQRARERGKRDLKLEKQWIAEIAYKPARSEKTYRLVIRRQRIEESEQGELFELWRYRYVLTNLPSSVSTEEVVRQTYRRCDQENVIEQLQNGVAAMRMPTGGFLANYAHLVCARLAHNLKSWLAMLALPSEVMRWEWKRFRKAFVYIAARILRTARQNILRLADSHRFAKAHQYAIVRLQT
jgi:hypothetical protein